MTAPRGGDSTSIIGRGAELVGDLEGSGQLRVEGKVDGTIRMDGQVQIAAGGAVDGRIEADEVVAAGRVDGTIAARDAVRLEDGCHVEADVYSPVLQLSEGGMLNGRVDMSGSELPEQPEVDAGEADEAGRGDAAFGGGDEGPSRAVASAVGGGDADDGEDAAGEDGDEDEDED